MMSTSAPCSQTTEASQALSQVLKSYHAIEHYLEKLHNAMGEDHLLGAWMQDFTQPNELLLQATHPRERAFNGISQLAYLPGQAPREIIICAGFIGACAATLDIVNELNAAKTDFKQAILNLKSKKISLRDPFFNNHLNDPMFSTVQRENQTAMILKKSGLAHLQLKQCYRQIPVLAHPASYISWTWAHTRSIKKITVAQAYDKLFQKTKKNHSVSIELQIKKLAALSPDTPLAIVQELAPHLRTNIVLQPAEGEKKRLMIKGSLPIFYPATLSTPIPVFKAPTPKCDKNKERVIRSDVQLDPVPFLPSIRVHRYLKVPELSVE